MLFGRGSLDQPLSESDLLRERVSDNIGEASDEQISANEYYAESRDYDSRRHSNLRCYRTGSEATSMQTSLIIRSGTATIETQRNSASYFNCKKNSTKRMSPRNERDPLCSSQADLPFNNRSIPILLPLYSQ